MPAYKFSPNLASPEERRETFVAREAILEDLLNRVRNIESGARHCILIGPRGIGKTHVLLLLADRVEADETLASQWEVIRFAEEEYSITSLAELLLKIAGSLPDGDSKTIGRDVDLALAHILEFSATSGKRLLLLMDNIQLYFSQLPDTDIGRLRDILMSNSTFLIIGAAPSYFKQMTGYEEPFYNFFEPIHLAELRPEEVEDMLRRRAQFEGKQEFLREFDGCRPKIRTTAHLTGGNPRLILMLYQVMCESDVVEAGGAFKRLLDDLTPYFQGRMEGLPPQGGKVLDTLASMKSPSTPTELAEVAGMSVNTVTTHIKRLRDAGFIRQVKLKRSRTTRYEVTERLFRMWREMRTEAGEQRLGFLVRFLKLWYTTKDLLQETGKLLTQLEKAREQERARLLSHLQYLKEAIPDLLRPEFERIYSHAETGSFELAGTWIFALKELAGYEEYIEAKPHDAIAWRKRGLALGKLGKYQEALESFDRAIQLQPDVASAWSNRGSALAGLGRYEEAFESYDRAIQLQSDLAIAWNNRGSALVGLRRYEEALESYDRAVQIQPNYADAWHNRGTALEELSRYKEALESFAKATQLRPNDSEVWNHHGVALERLGRYEEALKSFDRVTQLQPDDAKAWSNRGVVLDKLGRYEEALKSFDKATRLQPDLAAIWNNRGTTLFRLDRCKEALESYDKAVQLESDDAEFWYNRGLVLIRLGRHEEALGSYDKVVQIQPALAPVWSNRGWVLSELGRCEEALESLDKAVKLQPDDAVAWHNRGVALARLGKRKQALESYDKAVEVQPDLVAAWMGRSSILVRLGRHEEALESLDKAVQLQPDLAATWASRGLVLQRLTRYEEALENLNEAVRLQPYLASAWSSRGLALAGLGRYEEALESYNRAIQFQSNDAHTWNDHGAMLYNLGRYEEALKSCNRAIELQPDDAYVWNGRGVVLSRLGRHEEALENYNEAIKFQPDDVVAWSNRGWELNKLSRHKEALESCDKAIQLQPGFAMARINRGLALVNLGEHDEALESLKKASQLANEQNLEDAAKHAALLAAETELSSSRGNLSEDNLGLARSALKEGIENGKQANTGDFELLLFGYLKGALKSGRIQFVQEAIEIIVSELGREYDELLRPFKIALDYIQTEDVSILERLQQEVRELVLEIAEQAKSDE